jgi:hypothetical protein
MRRTRLHPRPEQVAALTQGIALPLPPLPESVLRVVAETLVRAWRDLTVEHGETLCKGDEAEVSALLEARLIALRDEDACWESVASGVSRGREGISFDGCHLEKRPDLSIHLTHRRFNFPLVAECKLIDRRDDKTVALYCSHGLIRFIKGEYAWMSREAFMLAYVRDGSNIAGCLRPRLAKSGATDPGATEVLPTPVSGASADLARSRHRRNFTYLPPTPSPDPGAIELWHLWLPAAP